MNRIIIFVVLLIISFTITSCTKKERNELPVTGLVFYSSFDGSFTDQSGRDIPVLDYSRKVYVPGVKGKAIDFDGSSDYLEVPDSLKSSRGLSMSFWVKTKGLLSTENNGVIIGKYSFTTNARSFLIYAGGANTTRNDNRISAAFYYMGSTSSMHDNAKSYMDYAELLTYPSNPSLWSILNPTKLTLDKWTHVVINMTPTTLSVWLDNVLCVSKTREYQLYYDSSDEPVMIGNCFSLGDGFNNHFHGQLDELRVYNRPLTESEITILYKDRQVLKVIDIIINNSVSSTIEIIS